MAGQREGLGVALAVSSSGFIGASFIVKKKGLRVRARGLRRLPEPPSPRPPAPPSPPCLVPGWQGGALCGCADCSRFFVGGGRGGRSPARRAYVLGGGDTGTCASLCGGLGCSSWLRGRRPTSPPMPLRRPCL